MSDAEFIDISPDWATVRAWVLHIFKDDPTLARSIASKMGSEAPELPPPPPPCDAFLYHGPGHQSKSRCEVKGPHDVHVTHYSGGQRATWRDGSYTNKLRAQNIEFDPESYPENMGMTGFFNEPPEDES